MAVYEVTIRGTVIKTLEVDAASEMEAIAKAHILFTVQTEVGVPEKYDEEPVSICRVAT